MPSTRLTFPDASCSRRVVEQQRANVPAIPTGHSTIALPPPAALPKSKNDQLPIATDDLKNSLTGREQERRQQLVEKLRSRGQDSSSFYGLLSVLNDCNICVSPPLLEGALAHTGIAFRCGEDGEGVALDEEKFLRLAEHLMYDPALATSFYDDDRQLVELAIREESYILGLDSTPVTALPEPNFDTTRRSCLVSYPHVAAHVTSLLAQNSDCGDQSRLSAQFDRVWTSLCCSGDAASPRLTQRREKRKSVASLVRQELSDVLNLTTTTTTNSRSSDDDDDSPVLLRDGSTAKSPSELLFVMSTAVDKCEALLSDCSAVIPTRELKSIESKINFRDTLALRGRLRCSSAVGRRVTPIASPHAEDNVLSRPASSSAALRSFSSSRPNSGSTRLSTSPVNGNCCRPQSTMSRINRRPSTAESSLVGTSPLPQAKCGTALNVFTMNNVELAMLSSKRISAGTLEREVSHLDGDVLSFLPSSAARAVRLLRQRSAGSTNRNDDTR